jgi:hypothetical protein
VVSIITAGRPVILPSLHRVDQRRGGEVTEVVDDEVRIPMTVS